MSAETAVSPDARTGGRAWERYIEATLGFRDHWYPVRFSSDLAPETPEAVTLLGEKLLLNRIDGQVFAIKDRCLHRGVPFSSKIECHTKSTITCWYHGWTYRWDTGRLVDILTNPDSVQIGRHALKTYPVVEAKGVVFVFLGDAAPPPLVEDVPPGFLDADRAIFGKHRIVESNWRLGAENGFDAGHAFIHKDAGLLADNDIALPLGFAPGDPDQLTRAEVAPGAPKGVFDLLGAHSRPVFEASIEGEPRLRGHLGETRVADNISIWLPGVLRVEPWPDPSLTQYEWYVPVDAGRHLYFQALGKKVGSDGEAAAFGREVQERWIPLALDGFNDIDVMAREATEAFYADGRGWRQEVLYETDRAIVEWRRLASEHGRTLQTTDHL